MGGQPTVDPRPVLDAHGQLQGCRCLACGYAAAPPVPRCPACGRPTVSALFAPRGRVWSSTVVRAAAAAGDAVPYVVAYIDIDAGPRVLARGAGELDLLLDSKVELSTAPDGSLSASPAGAGA